MHKIQGYLIFSWEAYECTLQINTRSPSDPDVTCNHRDILLLAKSSPKTG